MQLEMILYKFGQFSVPGNAAMGLETVLFQFGQIWATGNALILMKTGFISIQFYQFTATKFCKFYENLSGFVNTVLQLRFASRFSGRIQNPLFTLFPVFVSPRVIASKQSINPTFRLQ